jgi:hypothetical protein
VFRIFGVPVSPMPQNLVYPPAAVLSRADSTSVVDVQKSVTSKPLIGWCCMTNRWKARRVANVFGFQLSGRIAIEQPQSSLFHTAVRFQSSFIAFDTKLVAMGK